MFHLNNSINFDRFVNLINSASNFWPEAFITDLKGGGDYQSRGKKTQKKKRGADSKVTLDTLSHTFTVLCAYEVSSSKFFKMPPMCERHRPSARLFFIHRKPDKPVKVDAL